MDYNNRIMPGKFSPAGEKHPGINRLEKNALSGDTGYR